MDRKNIIIGLDGATWEIMDYFMDEDIMPNLKMIKYRGSYGDFRSTLVPVTPPAWTSLMTGCNAAQNGIFHFLKYNDKNNTYASSIANGSDIQVPTMWEIFSKYGRKVVSVNVPMTFPPRKINGVMITGMETPNDEEKFTYPSDIKTEFQNNGIDYRIDTELHKKRDLFNDDDFVEQMYSNGGEIFFKDLNDLLVTRTKAISYLLNNKKWHYFMFVIIGIDRIQHHYWDYIKDAELAPEITENIKKYYRAVDEFIGEIYSEYESQANLFVISDHGFTKLRGEFNINAWLSKKGFLSTNDLKVSRGGMLRGLARTVRKKYGSNLKKVVGKFVEEDKLVNIKLLSSAIDWNNTKAYSKATNSISINLKGRDTLGTVEPDKYEETRKEIMEELKNLTNNEGVKIINNVYKKEEIYGDEELQHIPDIIFEFKDENTYQGLPVQNITKEMSVFRTYEWLKGFHIRNGIIMAKGKDIKRGKIEGEVNIEDFLPTLLALNDEKIPDHFDGKVISAIIEGETKEEYIKFDYHADDQKYKYGEEGEDDVKGKLESLGYM